MNNVMTRFDEAAKHYKQYRTEILEAGRSEWGVDPYEWECFSKMSPIESDLWRCIRAVDAVLYPQFPIGRYFADFCNPVAGVVIECDGAMWHQDAEKDAKRQNAIEAKASPFIESQVSNAKMKHLLVHLFRTLHSGMTLLGVP
jgi:hypothetical protein